MYGCVDRRLRDTLSRFTDADRSNAISCSKFGDGVGTTGADDANVETMLVLTPLDPVPVVTLKKLSEDFGGGGLSSSMIPSSICTTFPMDGRCAGCSWMHQKLTWSARCTCAMSMSSPGSFLSKMPATLPFSSAYCADAGPYFGLCRQNHHHSANSHRTSPATAATTTSATTQPRTPELPPEPDAVEAPGVGLGCAGKQTLTKEALTKLETLRKQRPEPSESAVDATQDAPERQLRRHAVIPTKNCSVVISGG
ncbi:hypothetical protein EJB05_03449, partial [Eragrostis curvula]